MQALKLILLFTLKKTLTWVDTNTLIKSLGLILQPAPLLLLLMVLTHDLKCVDSKN